VVRRATTSKRDGAGRAVGNTDLTPEIRAETAARKGGVLYRKTHTETNDTPYFCYAPRKRLPGVSEGIRARALGALDGRGELELSLRDSVSETQTQ